MRFDRADWSPAGARALVAAMLVAGVMALLAAAPVAAERGPARLTDPSVSPVEVTSGQSVTFTVVYSNGQGNGPASIVVAVGSSTYPMSAPADKTNYGGGVAYAAVVAPPAGTWPVEFIATDKFGNTATLAGAPVTVVVPVSPPTPRPTPTPTPRPTPTPAPTPTSPPTSPPSPGQTPAPTSGAPGASTGSGGTAGSGGSTGSSGSGGGASGGGSSADGPVLIGGGAATLDDGIPPWQASMRGGAAVAAGRTSEAVPNTGSTATGDDWKVGWLGAGAGGAAGSGDDWKVGGSQGAGSGGVDVVGAGGATSLAPSFSAAFGASSGAVPLEQLLTTAIVTLGGVAMAMSFMLFGRRRRDDDPTDTDEALATAAAMGPGAIGTGALVGGMGRRTAPVPVTQPRDAELDLPRWRRPSLLAARKEDPLRVAHADPKLTFDQGAVAPIDGVERRAIRYRLVRLLDSPDELIAGEVGCLDEGDEVQLLRRTGAYWLVLCPDGREGWVHRMVLGDVVGDAPTEPGTADAGRSLAGRRDGSYEGDAAGIRLASDGVAAWSLQGAAATDAGMDIDEDVLRAYLAARGRT